MTSDIKFTDLIGNMLSNRRYFVELNGQKSRWRNQKNGLPQGSVLSPVLFNIYTNDQPIHKDTRSFIYADNLCIATKNVYIIVIYDVITVDYCKCILLYSPLNSYLYVHWILDFK